MLSDTIIKPYKRFFLLLELISLINEISSGYLIGLNNFLAVSGRLNLRNSFLMRYPMFCTISY